MKKRLILALVIAIAIVLVAYRVTRGAGYDIGLGYLGSGEPSPVELLQLDDSGSTNTSAWILTVNTDGSGSLTNNIGRTGGRNKTFKSSTFAAQALSNDLTKLNLMNLPYCSSSQSYPPVSEARFSASFGSSASLVYRGKMINEFCPNDTAETKVAALLQNAVATANP